MYDTERFLALQKNRLSELREMADKQIKGETVDITGIIGKLKRAGILDTNGDLAYPYK